MYSFVPPSGTIKNFSADLKEFYNYLEKNHQFPASKQNIIGESYHNAEPGNECVKLTCARSLPNWH